VSSKKVVVIGAGIAGLSAGCYLQMNGYHAQIFESHNKPGGLCTAWKRKGYTIEGGMHGLLGSSPPSPFYTLWSELVDMERIKFINWDLKAAFEFEDRERFYIYADLERLERYLKEISPEDGGVVEEFVNGVRRMQKFEMAVDKPRELFSLSDYLKMIRLLPVLSFMKKWIKVPAEDFAKRFKNPFLREAMRFISSPVLFEMLVLSVMDKKVSGYPACGSLRFARLFEEKFLSLGGKINYNSRVSKILVSDDKAVGVQLENGEERVADIVISAADGRSTIFELLDGRFIDKRIADIYENMKLNPSKIQVSLGVNRELEDVPHLVKFILDKPFVICDGTDFASIDLQVFKKIPTLVPPGKTLLVVQLHTTNDAFWTDLRAKEIDRYREAKDEVTEGVIDVLDKKLGGIRQNIDMVDVATPATYIRYTGNWRGSTQGWVNENIFKPNPVKKELPGLSDFYMAGQWVEPGGGVPNALKSGRDIAQIICMKDKKRFRAEGTST